jgi:hypothetical protein
MKHLQPIIRPTRPRNHRPMPIQAWTRLAIGAAAFAAALAIALRLIS